MGFNSCSYCDNLCKNNFCLFFYLSSYPLFVVNNHILEKTIMYNSLSQGLNKYILPERTLPLKKLFSVNIFVLPVILLVISINAQDLEPRILASLPTGTNIALVSYGHSSGNILLDNSAPIEGLNANLNNTVFAYARSFKLFNKLTKFDVVTPYSFARFNGGVIELDSSTTRNGFGDPLLRISMLLVGSPPLEASEFIKHDPVNFKLGVFFRIRVPIGQYDSEKLINLSSNRWGFKTGVAGSYTIKRKLIFEAHLTSWFFTKNTNYFRGNISDQEPLYGMQFHTGYVLNQKIWFAASIGKVYGGKVEINGDEQDIKQKNSRFGLVFSYRLSRRHSLKTAYTNGLTTRAGTDFNTFLIAYQYIWLDKKNSKKK